MIGCSAKCNMPIYVINQNCYLVPDYIGRGNGSAAEDCFLEDTIILYSSNRFYKAKR